MTGKDTIFTDIGDTVFDGLYQKALDSGLDSDAAKASVLRQSVEARYGAHGNAMRHMDHFLSAKGTSVSISLARIMQEDVGVRTRIEGEVWRRANGLKTYSDVQFEHDRVRMSTKRGNDNPVIDPIITLFQQTYAIEDWSGALGTYPIRWEAIACPASTSAPLLTRLTGSNRYRWHPEEGRPTRRLHQFASDLIANKKAAEFDMVLIPETHQINQIAPDRRVNIEKQYNPKHSKLGDYFTSDQLELVEKGACYYDSMGDYVKAGKAALCAGTWAGNRISDAAAYTKHVAGRILK
jgi:hypothetical protein